MDWSFIVFTSSMLGILILMSGKIGYRIGYKIGLEHAEKNEREAWQQASSEAYWRLEQDLSKCPRCDGPADNGHDRCYPPNPYVCTKCEKTEWAENGFIECPGCGELHNDDSRETKH